MQGQSIRMCSIEGCSRKYQARGLCAMHYGRWKYNGDPNIHSHRDRPAGDTDEERFMSRVDQNGPVARSGLTPCWLWTDRLFREGYGTTRVDDRDRYAHRLSHILFIGPIPDGMLVCHHCDNRACVRPDHLFVGTHQDNMDDREAKGRRIPASGSAHGRHTRPECSARGERSGTAKLTDDIVRDIRRRRAAGESLIEIGLCYHIDRTHVWAICARKAWKHVE